MSVLRIRRLRKEEYQPAWARMNERVRGSVTTTLLCRTQTSPHGLRPMMSPSPRSRFPRSRSAADTFGLTGRPFPRRLPPPAGLLGQAGRAALSLGLGLGSRLGVCLCSRWRRLFKDLLPWLGYLPPDGMQNPSSLFQRNNARGRLPAAGHHLVDPGLVLDRGVTL